VRVECVCVCVGVCVRERERVCVCVHLLVDYPHERARSLGSEHIRRLLLLRENRQVRLAPPTGNSSRTHGSCPRHNPGIVEVL
jgi:hypothetical protein